MIIGVFLRNFKTYSGINYIPLTNGNSFCGLVGNNGIGKSSVLEAFDCLFNGKPWNYNIVVKKRGLQASDPYIVPIYLLSTSQVSDKNIELFQAISDYIWNAEETEFLPQNRTHFKPFQKQRDILKNTETEDLLLIPLGLSYDSVPSFSIFNTRKFAEKTSKVTHLNEIQGENRFPDSDLKEYFLPLHKELKELFEYIYIPKDINLDDFTQLETKEIQSLMGRTLNEIVEKCVPPQNIQDINSRLNEFIASLSSILGDYSFRTPSDRQVNLKKNDVYKLIIDAYFKIRKLHKKEGERWLGKGSLPPVWATWFKRLEVAA
jgi:predicted ATP-dependent endonuclease of OLD family